MLKSFLTVLLFGILVSCDDPDPGLSQRLAEVEAERESLTQELREQKIRQQELLDKKRGQIALLEEELEAAKASNIRQVVPQPSSPPTSVALASPSAPKKEMITRQLAGVIFVEGDLEFFIGSDDVKRRVFRKSDGLGFVKIDGRERLLLGVDGAE